MFVVDPGREYLLEHVNGIEPTALVFTAAGGPTDQEVLRALIHRAKFCHLVGEDGAEDDEDPVALANLRGALLAIEARRARSRGAAQVAAFHGMLEDRQHRIEDEPPCATCGHLRCVEHAAAPVAP